MNLEERKLKYFKVWLAIGYAYVAYIIYGSLTPDPIQIDVDDFDKVMHFAAYALLMTWFGMIFFKTPQRYAYAVTFILLGVVIEFLQQAGGVRYFEYSDMLANSLGVVAGFYVTKGCGKYHLWRIEQAIEGKPY